MCSRFPVYLHAIHVAALHTGGKHHRKHKKCTGTAKKGEWNGKVWQIVCGMWNETTDSIISTIRTD